MEWGHCWTQITGFGASFSISLALPQLWQVGDTYRVACLVLKKGLQHILEMLK
jgi:hypothetical protein